MNDMASCEQAPARAAGRDRSIAIVTSVAAVVMSAVLAYWPPVFLRIGYVWDDVQAVREVPHYARWTNVVALFTPRYFEMFNELSYRPVSTFTFFLDRWLYGASAVGHRATQLFLHIACSVAVFVAVRCVVPGLVWAAFAGVLFAAHPVLNEAVVVMAFREDLLAALFALTSFTVFAVAVRSGKRSQAGFLALSALLFALAVFSKESAVALPAVLLIALWKLWRQQHGSSSEQNRWKVLLLTLPHWGVLAAYAVVRFVILRNPVEGTVGYAGGSFTSALWATAGAFALNVRRTLLPYHLSVDYAVPTGSSMNAALGVGVFLAFAGLITAERGRLADVAVGLSWFVLFLAPVSNLVPIANPVADRYLYLPTVGLLMALAAVSARQGRCAGYGAALLIVACTAFIIQNVDRGVLWYVSGGPLGESEAVWRRSLTVCPSSAAVRATLAGFYAGRGMPEKAEQMHRKLEEIYRTRPDVDASRRAYLLYNLGVGAMERRDMASARRFFEQAADAMQGFALAEHKVAVLDMMAGNHAAAERRLLTLKRRHPDFLDAYISLGELYRTQGSFQSAMVQYRQALAIQPSHKDALRALGITQLDARDSAGAIETFGRLCRREPRNAEYAFLLGAAYDAAGNLDLALQEYVRAATLDARMAAAANSVAGVHARRGQHEEAVRWYLRVLEIDPRSAVGHFNLAMSLRALGQSAQAMEYLRRALELAEDPGFIIRVRNEIRSLSENMR